MFLKVAEEINSMSHVLVAERHCRRQCSCLAARFDRFLGFPFLAAFESFNAMTHDLLVSNDLYMQGSLAFHDCIFKMHLTTRPVRVRVTQDQNRIDIACMGNYIFVSLYGMGPIKYLQPIAP